MGQASLRHNCRTKTVSTKSRYGYRQPRAAISCCGPAEWLHWYALSPNWPNATWRDDVPVFVSNKLVPDKNTFGLLRQTTGACRSALGRRVGISLFSHVNHLNGLSISVGMAMRAKFGAMNYAPCLCALRSPSRSTQTQSCTNTTQSVRMSNGPG